MNHLTRDQMEPELHASTVTDGGIEYRLLPVGTELKEGDQILEHTGQWEPVVDLVGFEVEEGEFGEYRRPLPKRTGGDM